MSTTAVLQSTAGTDITVRTNRHDESIDRYRESTIDTLTAGICGALLDRSGSIVEHYRSDHARDTLWIRRLIAEGFEELIATGRIVWFEYSASNTGTTIGTDAAEVKNSRSALNLNVTLSVEDIRDTVGTAGPDRLATFRVIVLG